MNKSTMKAWLALLLPAVTGCGPSSAPAGTDPAGPPPILAPGASRCGTHAWCDTSLSPAARSALLLAQLTLQQKIDLMAGDDPLGVATGKPATGTVNGVPALDLPNLYMSDGPVGPREGKATAFPSPLALAASFDPALARRVGATIANEVRFKGNDLLHGPTVDVMRVPLAGRSFETYGEDPFLAAALAPEWIKGAQSQGVIANVKHFLMNHQEGQIGLPPAASLIGDRHLVDAIADERTVRELYLPPFEAAVKTGGAGSVMCAYNSVNGAPACSNRHLLQEILRDEWQFDGFVVSDYFLALRNTTDSANNGADIEMPVAQFYAPLLLQLAVIGGQVPEAVIDTRVGNTLRTLFRFGFFDRAAFPSDDALIDQSAHAVVARENLEEGIVLLRNTGVLPISPNVKSIAVIGSVAETYVNGGGSSNVTPFAFKKPLQALIDRAGPGTSVRYDDGSNSASAAATAAAAEIAIVFVRDTATEGVDKYCLGLDCSALPYLPSATPQDDLIRAVAAVNPRTVVVIENSSPVLTPWRESVAALLAAWYPGQEAGPAIARVLFGDVDASGRLPVSFMAAEGDTPFAGNVQQYPGFGIGPVQYSEGLFTGYRWHDRNNIAPAYPFGHGLSYTQFRYSDLRISATEIRATVTNIGGRSGIDVPQLYIGFPQTSAAVPQPVRQLKGFKRLTLAPGQAATVRFPLDTRSLSYWDVTGNNWKTDSGCYAISVGASSRDLPLTGTLAVNRRC